MIRLATLSCLSAILLASTSLRAQEATATATAPTAETARVQDSWTKEPSQADIDTFRAHVEWLANPFMKGRLPGTPEMEFAREYIQHWMIEAGLKPAWGGDNSKVIGEGATSYRQPFRFNGNRSGKSAQLKLNGEKLDLGEIAGSGWGSKSGAGALTFVGYGIDRGIDGYRGFEADDELRGRVAVSFLYEPLNDAGKSRWTEGDGFTNRSSLRRRLRSFRRRGATGALFIVPPGVQSDLEEDMKGWVTGRGRGGSFPVAILTAAQGEKLMKAAGSESSLMEMRKKADAGRVIVPMEAKVAMDVQVEITGGKEACNVGGIVPGKGKLAHEIVVVGAHIDHLGVGNFGSRAPKRRGEVHPGADDNASGTAAIIMMAERVVKYYATLPEDADARTVLFIGLDAEEQGLHGAAHYASNPLVPAEDHQLMVNFDMIGRITDKQLRVDGTQSGEGLAEIADPLFEASPLVIKPGRSIMMASDHAAFFSAKIPVLFGIITPFHDDYHTPEDTTAKINSKDAVHVVELFTQIALRAALTEKDIKFTGESRMPRQN
jgi:Peptidase family M28